MVWWRAMPAAGRLEGPGRQGGCAGQQPRQHCPACQLQTDGHGRPGMPGADRAGWAGSCLPAHYLNYFWGRQADGRLGLPGHAWEGTAAPEQTATLP